MLPVNVALYMQNSDLVAARKASGVASCTSKLFMCDECKCSFPSLVDHKCYDPNSEPDHSHLVTNSFNISLAFELRDPWRYVKYAYRARYASHEVREEIAAQRGVRWSTLNELPGFLPSRDSLLDYMHMIFLCA